MCYIGEDELRGENKLTLIKYHEILPMTFKKSWLFLVLVSYQFSHCTLRLNVLYLSESEKQIFLEILIGGVIKGTFQCQVNVGSGAHSHCG